MAYDNTLALRVTKLLATRVGLDEKKMFGGVGYLLNGNMACGVHKEYLIVRVGPDRYQGALDETHTKVFDITGRPMTGWVMVAPDGCSSSKALELWVEQGVDFASSLPPK